jgi:putative ATP-binding cassette transporter
LRQGILRHLFDLPAVLRRRKPFSALVGGPELLLLISGVLSQSVVLDVWNNFNRCAGARAPAPSCRACADVPAAGRSRLAKTLYMRDLPLFKKQMVQVAVISLAYTALNSVTSAANQQLRLKWSRHLTSTVHAKYLRSRAYYRLQGAGSAVPDPDARITGDISSVSSTLAALLFTSISVSVNSVSAIVRLAVLLSPRYVLICGGYLLLMEKYREWVMPAIKMGMMSGEMALFRGEFARAHMKLQEHSEAILTAGGTATEARAVDQLYSSWTAKMQEYQALTLREWWWYSGIVMTLLEPTLRAALIQGPVLIGARSFDDYVGMQRNSEVLADMTYTSTLVNRMMGQTRQAMNLPRSLLSVAGNAARVAELLEACDCEQALAARKGQPGGQIRFENATVQTPDGKDLVRGLTLAVAPGGGRQNLLIVGPNGAGKTSLFRALSGLWPAAAGAAHLPASVCFAPQVPYCVVGTLEALVAYPGTGPMAPARLREVLTAVGLGALAARPDAAERVDWEEALSLGEKQRLVMARLLLQAPAFAVLDECTSTLPESVATLLYRKLAALGTTVVSVSQRPVHAKYHGRQLTLDGAGGWDLCELGTGSATKNRAKAAPKADGPPRRSPLGVLAGTNAVRPLSPQGLSPGGTVQRQGSGGFDASPKGSPDASAGKLAADVDAATVERSAPYAAAAAVKPLPKASTRTRVGMVLKVLLQPSLADRGAQLVAATLGLIVFQIYLSSKVLSLLPGKLQGLVIQADRAAYVRLTLVATGCRFISMIGSLTSIKCSHALSIHWRSVMIRHVTARALGPEGHFYALKHVDKRISDVETRLTDDCMQLTSWIQNFINQVFSPTTNAVVVTMLLFKENMPMTALVVLGGYALVGVAISKWCVPDFATNQSRASELHSAFRRAHKRLLSSAESVAFMRGEEAELAVLDGRLGETYHHNLRVTRERIGFDCGNSFFLNRIPSLITSSLRMQWSMGYGTDEQIMGEAGGGGIAAKADYIGNLLSRSARPTPRPRRSLSVLRDTGGELTHAAGS